MIPINPTLKLVIALVLVGGVGAAEAIEKVEPAWTWLGMVVQALTVAEVYFTIPAKTAAKLAKIAPLLALCFAASGCMVAIPQPGQTPAQVQACSTDATLRNIALGTAGGLTTAAGVQAAVASQEGSNQGLTQALAVSGAITAGVAAVLVGGSALLGQTYNADGCAPALPAGAQK